MDASYPPRPLSEKAKGKQRATEPAEDDDDEAPPTSRTLTIRFTEGVADLTVEVREKETVRDLKAKIRALRPTLHNRRLRLIHSGRLLTDGTFIYGWLKSLEDHQRRANGDLARTSTDGAAEEPTWLHCSIGLEVQEEDEGDDREPKAQMTPLRGFDRLASAGFTEEDIATIRRQFRLSRGLDNNSGSLDEDDEDEHARALEEQWIDNLDGPDSAVDQSLEGTGGLYTTLLQGVTTGFFFGFIPFFFFNGQRPPAFFSDTYESIEPQGSAVYSRRMQMALVIGLLLNILIGMMKYLY